MKLQRSLSSLIITAAFLIHSAPAAAYAAEHTAGSLTAETVDFYQYWKEKYLVQNPYTEESQYYVFYGEQTYEQAGSAVEVTVSEAHGYGMLIAASMAAYDKQAKDIFDGMYRYYKAHPSEIGPNLMAWQQVDNGSAILNTSGADSASDGDMDIAYALLMADCVWGSDGEINYKQAAVDVINDIMTYEVNQTDWVIQLGDWAHWSKPGDVYYSATRSSDFIVQYMPAFADAAEDDRWLTLYENTYAIIGKLTEENGTGILPDFIIKDSSTGEFTASPANFLESENDGNYYYNACRTPWRIAMDYLMNGNPDAKKFADTINAFIIKKTGGDPEQIMAGYTPSGTPVSDWNDLCFDAPFIISAACSEDRTWHDALRELCLHYGEDVYFGDTITMLCLIVDDGGWIVPEPQNSPVRTDTNRIVGYLPDWSYQAYKEIDFSLLTHINIAFCNPDENGTISCEIPDADMKKLVSAAHQNNVEVFAALGGAGGCESYLSYIDTPEEMTAFSENIIAYCEKYDLDGIDLDIELAGSHQIWSYYDGWCRELRTLCDQNDRKLSTATAQWAAEKVSPETFALFDFVNVMAYDNDLDKVSHASYEYAQTCLDYFSSEKKIPDQKLVLGVPFYGRGYLADGSLDWNSYMSFSEIIGKDAAYYNQDSYHGIAYNGAATIAKKTELAKQYGGIMIWELSQDAKGEHSLIKVIHDTFDQNAETIKGDVNADGRFDTVDIILFQKWLLAVPDTALADWRAADLYEDDRLDIFDLGMMKQLLLAR